VLDGQKSLSPKTTQSNQERSSVPDWNFSRISVRPAPLAIQTKLTINQPGDQYEQEADRIANQVIGSPSPVGLVPVRRNASPAIQRACACGGTCDKCKEDEEHEHIQRKPTPPGNAAPATAPPIVNDVLSSSGQPLDSATRAFMEPRFGYDFSSVRIHSDEKAAASAQALGARAYTLGSHIVFSRGESSPADSAARQLMAHELTHVIQQQAASENATIMRAPEKDKPAPPPPPAPCTINCTAHSFLKLSPDDRAAQFDSQCPQGYPRDTTFFGQSIPSASSKKLHDKLLAAASRAKRLMCINGTDPNAYALDRKVRTYGTHSPSESRAVDIDYEGQTYILHEKYAHKADVESQLSPVYNRIAFWAHGAKSIVPRGIQTVSPVDKGAADARTWTNPDTGKTETTTTGELYDKLKTESDAMTQYFELLTESDLAFEVDVKMFVRRHTADIDAAKKLGLPTGDTDDDVKKFRQRVVDDYRLLGGSKAQLKSFAGQADADLSHSPPTVKEDGKDVELARPFRGGAVKSPPGKTPDPAENRRPELGFVTLPKEVVVALTQEGLVWGAIDFGAEAGDVMHFDCRRDISGC